MQDGVFQYKWDRLGALVERTQGGTRIRYLYTADDERIGVVTFVGSQVGRIDWSLRGLDNKVLSDFRSSGGTTGTTNWKWRATTSTATPSSSHS